VITIKYIPTKNLVKVAMLALLTADSDVSGAIKFICASNEHQAIKSFGGKLSLLG
jgi:hypothetical protein